MNHTQIHRLLVITKSMSITRTAKELYITQPALSHAVSDIENELGIKIFFRDNNRLILTDQGRKVVQGRYCCWNRRRRPGPGRRDSEQRGRYYH